MKRDVLLFLSDIIENMTDAVQFLGTMDFPEFQLDKKTANAVIRSLEVVGEAAKNIPEEIRTRAPEVPWKDMAGLRDKCIHMYFGVNHRRVWEVVKEDIPQLRPFIKALFDKLQAEQAR